MIQDNSPALGWVRLANGVVSFHNKLYFIPSDCTVKKYIYWNSSTPDRFEFSDTILEENSNRFLVVINDNGQSTICHSKTEYFSISFNSESQTKIEQKIYGVFKEFTDEKGRVNKQFSNIIEKHNEISQTVGEIQESQGSLIQKTTVLEQTADGIRQTIEKNTREYKNTEFSEKIIATYTNFIGEYGQLSNVFNMVSADNKLDIDEEKQLRFRIDNCYKAYEELVALWKKMPENASFLGKTKEDLTKILNDYKNDIIIQRNALNTLLNDIITSGDINNTNRTSIVGYIGSIINKTSLQKKGLTSMLSDGEGGKSIDLISELILNSQVSGFEYVEKINNLTTRYSNLKVSLDKINSEVFDSQTGKSKIEQKANEILAEVKSKNDSLSSRIVLLENSIKTKVGTEQLYTAIEQNNENIVFNFRNGIKDKATQGAARESLTKASDKREVGGQSFYYFNEDGVADGYFETKTLGDIVFNEEGLTVNKGFIATDTLTVPYGHFPLIKLFGDKNKKYFPEDAYPSVDATHKNNTGFGDRIRLKWRNDCYISIGGRKTGSFNVFVHDYAYGESALFNVSDIGIFYKTYGVGYLVKEGTSPDDPKGVSIVFPGWGKLRILKSGAMKFESTRKGDLTDEFAWNH